MLSRQPANTNFTFVNGVRRQFVQRINDRRADEFHELVYEIKFKNGTKKRKQCQWKLELTSHLWVITGFTVREVMRAQRQMQDALQTRRPQLCTLLQPCDGRARQAQTTRGAV